MKALVECGAEVIALSRTEADLRSLKQEVHYNVFCTLNACLFSGHHFIETKDP